MTSQEPQVDRAREVCRPSPTPNGRADMVAGGVVGGYFRPCSERVHASDALDRAAPADVLKRRRTSIREKPPAFRGGMERH